MERLGVFNIRIFNVRYNSTFSLDRVYRVYLRDGNFYFVRIGGQYWGIQEAIAAGIHPLGLVGALIATLVVTLFVALLGSSWQERARKKKETLFQTLDNVHPEQLLDRHKHNFKLQPADFQASRIEPPARFYTHGPHVGRWKSLLRNGRKLNLELFTNEDMYIALHLLPDVIGPVLTINAQWDGKKGKYTKKGS